MPREPLFWSNPAHRPGLMARILSPLGNIYAATTARRVAKTGMRATCPVISVGNINAGGTGKTPTVIALLEKLHGLGRKPVVISRGYGGRLAGPVLVDPARHTAADVGDEPLLIAAFSTVVVAHDRAAGAALVQDQCDVIVLDDAHQNPGLSKDLSIVVVDAARGFGNGMCIPAGPLREPVAQGLARADMVISIGGPKIQSRFTDDWGTDLTVPHLKAELTPLETGMPWTGLPCFAFAGIGHPDKFFATLRGLGATLIHAEALSDHQPLTPQLLERLARDATAAGAQLVTTEKDAVRLPASWRPRVLTVPVRLDFLDDAPLDEALTGLFA